MKLKNLLALILLDYKSSVSVNTDVWVVPTVMKTQIEIEIEVEIQMKKELKKYNMYIQ